MSVTYGLATFTADHRVYSLAQSGASSQIFWRHASLITPDAHAAAFGLAASYAFWRWLRKPEWLPAGVAGVVLGFAELSKTTLILLYPTWIITWLIYRWSDRAALRARNWLREGAMIAILIGVSLYVLNFGYGFDGSFRLLGKYHFVSDLFTSSVKNSGTEIEAPPVNRFAGTSSGKVPVPLPVDYVLGIDIQQREFERHVQPSYLRGEWRNGGWWYFYFYACLIKVPLGLWMLALCLAIARTIRIKSSGIESDSNALDGNRRTDPTTHNRLKRKSNRDELALLLPAVAIFTVVSLKSGINDHMRYALPAFPYGYVFVGQIARLLSPSTSGLQRKFVQSSIQNTLEPDARSRVCSSAGAPKGRLNYVATFVVGFLWTWFVTSSLWIYPHSLCYFNETIGGPLHGAGHLLGSNLDWGQDDLYLQVAFPENSRTQEYDLIHINSEGALAELASVGKIPCIRRFTYSTLLKRHNCASSPDEKNATSAGEQSDTHVVRPHRRPPSTSKYPKKKATTPYPGNSMLKNGDLIEEKHRD